MLHLVHVVLWISFSCFSLTFMELNCFWQNLHSKRFSTLAKQSLSVSLSSLSSSPPTSCETTTLSPPGSWSVFLGGSLCKESSSSLKVAISGLCTGDMSKFSFAFNRPTDLISSWHCTMNFSFLWAIFWNWSNLWTSCQQISQTWLGKMSSLLKSNSRPTTVFTIIDFESMLCLKVNNSVFKLFSCSVKSRNVKLLRGSVHKQSLHPMIIPMDMVACECQTIWNKPRLRSHKQVFFLQSFCSWLNLPESYSNYFWRWTCSLCASLKAFFQLWTILNKPNLYRLPNSKPSSNLRTFTHSCIDSTSNSFP